MIWLAAIAAADRGLQQADAQHMKVSELIAMLEERGAPLSDIAEILDADSPKQAALALVAKQAQQRAPTDAPARTKPAAARVRDGGATALSVDDWLLDDILGGTVRAVAERILTHARSSPLAGYMYIMRVNTFTETAVRHK